MVLAGTWDDIASPPPPRCVSLLTARCAAQPQARFDGLEMSGPTQRMPFLTAAEEVNLVA